jgi:hypothetical protein
MDLKFLTKNISFNDKIKSVIYLRFISFQIWKFFLLLIFLISLFHLTHYFPFSFFSILNFDFISYIQIYFISFIIDYLEMELFIDSKSQFCFFEIVVNIFLVPSKPTFVFFVFILLNTMNLNILKSMSFSIENYFNEYITDDYNFDTNFLSILLSILLSLNMIGNDILFKWDEIEVRILYYILCRLIELIL